MSVRATGTVVDERGNAWDALSVALVDTGVLFSGRLATARCDSQGRFTLDYGADGFSARLGPRHLELQLLDRVRRVLLRKAIDDVAGDTLEFGTLTLNRADGEGWLVTEGTGAPRRLSQGNAVTLLMDRDAFEHAARLFREARKSVLVSQLFFGLPDEFATDAADEKTALIFGFRDPPPTVAAPRAAGVGDERPERLLLTTADLGADVRLLLNGFRFPMYLRLLAGALSTGLIGPLGLFGVVGAEALLSEKMTDRDEAERYFRASGRSGIQLAEFKQPIPSSGVMHAKLVVADGRHALSIGSPFSQSYIDSPAHAIQEPRRGGSRGLPKHDAGFGVTGPAVAHFHETLAMLWNEDGPDSRLPDTLDPVPPAQTEGGDAVCALQIVRTLSANRFDAKPDGEKAILEAYQRGIANAQKLIYLETQYFTDDAIGEALAAALIERPALQVVLLLNIEPDVPTYPFKQRRLITRIRRRVAKAAPGAEKRFGVFTRWSHDVAGVRPRLLPIYIHAKAAFVDDSWATIGSANLDGLSLDSSLLSDVLHKLFGAQEQRAIEVNGVMFNGVAGQAPSPIVERLRRRLWAEHLGYFRPDGSLDLEHADLSPGAGLDLWQARAAAKLARLKADPKQSQDGVGHVLAWPEEDETYRTPRKHLRALGLETFPAEPGEPDRSHALTPLRSVQPFDFDAGRFKSNVSAVLDYP